VSIETGFPTSAASRAPASRVTALQQQKASELRAAFECERASAGLPAGIGLDLLQILAGAEATALSGEDEDAHIRVYPPSSIDPEKVDQIERTMGERCNDILLETGLFLIGAVCDS